MSTVTQSMRNALPLLGDRWRGISRRFPLHGNGIIILLLALAALHLFGYQRMDLVVFALAVCAVTIVLMTMIMVFVTGIWLRRRLLAELTNPLPGCELEAGYPAETGFQLPAMPWLPLMELRWQVVSPDIMPTRIRLDANTGQLTEHITPPRRCQGNELQRDFTLSDVLGLARFTWRARQQVRLTVLPRTGNLQQLPALRTMDAADGIPGQAGTPQGDRMDIRRYTAGDSVRDIMWRVYARTRHLNVRLPEKSLFHSERTLAYLVADHNDEAAAGVARFAVENGLLGENWLLGCDGSEETANTSHRATSLIAGSRRPLDPPLYGLDTFLETNQGAGSACIVFASAHYGPWCESFLRTINRYKSPFTLVLATDAYDNVQDRSWWDAIIMAEKNHRQYDKNSLQSTSRLFAKRCERVIVVDRDTGRSFDPNWKKV